MGRVISILLLFTQVGMSGDYPLKNGKPTSKGIELYLEQNSDLLVKEYQDFVQDTIYNVWFYSDELKDLLGSKSLELGRFFPHEIYISTAELFEAYELDDLSPERRGRLRECNKFVKAAMIHELTHEYVSQIGMEMQSVHHMHLDKAYHTGLWVVKSSETYGSSFIEEGISEYITEKMGELIPPPHVEMPLTVEELFDLEREYMVKYKYASAYLKTFLDTTGIKKGVQILLHNPPPSYEEILQPGCFFGRLEDPTRW